MNVATDSERPVRQILQDIVGNLQDIIRLEVQLAKAELKREASKASKAVVLAALGVVLCIYAGGFLLLALVHGLSVWLAPWQAALVVGIAAALLASVFLTAARRRFAKIDVEPERALQNLTKDATWARDQIK